MATYRYLDVRRDIYEQCSNRTLNKFRTFAEMRKLFHPSQWVLLILLIVCIIAYIVIFMFASNTSYCIIPVGGIVLLNIADELFGNRMYNSFEREREIEEHRANLKVYIENIQSTLNKHGITTKEQRDTLTKECEQQLSIHNARYQSVGSKVFDMLVGVPLGALVSALIFKSGSADIVIDRLLLVLLLGLIIIVASNIVKKITYYSDGYFKDQYLLDVLNELKYLSE